MKPKQELDGSAPGAQPKPKRTPRVTAVRRIEPERPHRVWSLLLSPSIWSGRK